MQHQNTLAKNKWLIGSLLTLAILLGWNLHRTQANNPTFSLSLSSSCSSTLTQVEGMVGESKMIYICVDGSNEGAGFLGAETQVNYNSKLIKASQISCNNFDSCANLSEPGKVRFLAASAPLPEGNAVDKKERLGSFKIDFLQAGTGHLAYTQTQIINEENAIETRSGINANVTITEKEEPVIEEEEKVEEVIEPEPVEEKVEEVIVEEEKQEILPGLKGVLVSPVSKTAQPGQSIQLIGTAVYHGDRPNENITSCFTCPTKGTPNVSGKTTYQILSGPGQLSWSKVYVSPSAQNGEKILLKATFTDYKTNTTLTSSVRSITVYKPEEEKVEEVIEENEEVEVEEEAEPVKEPEIEVKPETWQWHAAAPEDPAQSLAEQAVLQALQKDSPLEIPRNPEDETCLKEFSSGLDSDQDGLSDRTECYLKLDATVSDTDADSCLDGDEINLFYTDPLVDDCSLEEMVTEKILITDPKPNWIVRSLDISGLAPQGVKEVEITAFPAFQRDLKTITSEWEKLVESMQEETEAAALETQKNELKTHVESLLAWADQQSESYAQERRSLSALYNFLNATENDLEEIKTISNGLDDIQQPGILLGVVETFGEAGLGDEVSSRFHLQVASNALPDGSYDLVAVGKENARILLSNPIRVSLEAQFDVTAPRPERLDDIELNLEGREGDALLSDLNLSIQNGRPVLSGRSAYGAQVFATWESLALASSIIADSQEGLFEIQAPRELESNTNHTITLYALMQDETGKGRSETVALGFLVTKDLNQWLPWLILVSILIILAGLVARHRMKMIDKLPPEHRAKENELYEAFGEVYHHDSEVPKDHEKKQTEIEDAFEKDNNKA